MKKINRIQANRRKTWDNIRTGPQFHNILKCSRNPAEKTEHRRLKWMIADFCWEWGLDFYSEAIFENNQRADMVISDWGVAIEILVSESRKQFQSKNYPLPTIPITSDDGLIEMLTELLNTDGSCWDYYAVD